MYKLKRDHSDWYAYKRDPELHDKIMKKKIHTLLEDRDRQGRRVYLIKLGKCNSTTRAYLRFYFGAGDGGGLL